MSLARERLFTFFNPGDAMSVLKTVSTAGNSHRNNGQRHSLPEEVASVGDRWTGSRGAPGEAAKNP